MNRDGNHTDNTLKVNIKPTKNNTTASEIEFRCWVYATYHNQECVILEGAVCCNKSYCYSGRHVDSWHSLGTLVVQVISPSELQIRAIMTDYHGHKFDGGVCAEIQLDLPDGMEIYSASMDEVAYRYGTVDAHYVFPNDVGVASMGGSYSNGDYRLVISCLKVPRECAVVFEWDSCGTMV